MSDWLTEVEDALLALRGEPPWPYRLLSVIDRILTFLMRPYDWLQA